MGMRTGLSSCCPMVLCMVLAGCGGGGGGAVQSTPTPTPMPAPAPKPTPVSVNYDTAEYRRSNAAMFDGAITAWNAGSTGAGVAVGIIDSGIDVTSPEFTGRISSASAAYGGNSGYQDQDGHGTAVAGILAAGRNGTEIMGVAFDASIIALRTDSAGTCASNDGCSFADRDIAAALNHATDTGARVVNLSLGGPDGLSPTLTSAIDRATKAGVILVVSAGNERDQATPQYDATNPSPFAQAVAAAGNGLVIIAASVDSAGQISSFSDLAGNSADIVLAALGEGVRSLDLGNDPTTYYVYSGTSFAAPQIAGAAALLKQAFPNLSSAQIVQLLLQSAVDAGATGTDAIYGHGILDIAAAFAPSGTTTLGSSATTVSLTQNGTLSSAMGDASGAAPAKVVAIDAIGRAYTLSVQRSLTPGASFPVLTSLRDGPVRSLSLGAADLAATIAFTDRGTARVNRFGEPVAYTDVGTVSTSLTLRVGATTSVSVASNTRLSPADGGDEGSFLAVHQSQDSFGFAVAPAMAAAITHGLGHGWHIGFVGEEGLLGRRDKNRARADKARDRQRYRLFAATLGWTGGPVSLTLSGRMLKESDTLLGARFAPFFGVAGGSTVFADAGARFMLPARWSLGLSARRGWTRAGGGNVRTRAWSADLARAGLISSRDRLELRIARPLRVTGGGIDALLPVEHNYASGSDDWRVTHIDLSPRGRETDGELGYSAPLAGGRIALNGYWRRDPGNNAWASDDIGGAVRFSVGY